MAFTIWPMTYYWLIHVGLAGDICTLGWVSVILVDRAFLAFMGVCAYLCSNLSLISEVAKKFQRRTYVGLYFHSVFSVMFFGNIANEVYKWYYISWYTFGEGDKRGIDGKQYCPYAEMKDAARLTMLYSSLMAVSHIFIAGLSYSFIRDLWNDVKKDMGLSQGESD